MRGSGKQRNKARYNPVKLMGDCKLIRPTQITCSSLANNCKGIYLKVLFGLISSSGRRIMLGIKQYHNKPG